MHITVMRAMAASNAISAAEPRNSHGAVAFSRACACLNFLSISAMASLLPVAAEAAAQAIHSAIAMRTGVFGRGIATRRSSLMPSGSRRLG